jgi:aminoglycoside phosphotransferase (APT) family kinase protein
VSTAVYEIPGEALVLKRYVAESRWKQAKEVHVYSLLAGVAGVPTVVDVDTEHGVTVMTRVAGEPLSSLELPDAAMRDVYRQIGALLAAVHAIAQPAFGYLTTELLDPVPHNTAYMTERFATKLTEFAEFGGDPVVHRLASAWVAERSGLLGLCAAPALCHNDVHEGNVLVDGGQVTGFIDVENSIAADPLMDLAKAVQYDLSRSPVKVAGLLAGYGPLPANGLARIELYRLYHALELWDWFAEIGNTGPLDSIAADIRELASP